MATKKAEKVVKEVKAEVKPETKVEVKASKKIKVSFGRPVICDAGEFKKGDVAELDEKTAETLLKITGVKKC